ncbi:hypothetical protein PVA45_03620 [Entomospira entomophila]|uniref:Uncharacterized protein n=1 Tax=Entomospira entomophila TaxID=2719988 RepID=A0A968GA37_9SPIO|nr:hypothetical protein [Entomospira entomophilus]NIZ40600.1 hypothetical protein [Entomospira entomophilus]WDI34815.1 hypothetical protein PVA45_03620 [Entomospira entomophilus]
MTKQMKGVSYVIVLLLAITGFRWITELVFQVVENSEALLENRDLMGRLVSTYVIIGSFYAIVISQLSLLLLGEALGGEFIYIDREGQFVSVYRVWAFSNMLNLIGGIMIIAYFLFAPSKILSSFFTVIFSVVLFLIVYFLSWRLLRARGILGTEAYIVELYGQKKYNQQVAIMSYLTLVIQGVIIVGIIYMQSQRIDALGIMTVIKQSMVLIVGGVLLSAPIRLFFSVKVFRKWFVVEDSAMVIEWLKERQLSLKEEKNHVVSDAP